VFDEDDHHRVEHAQFALVGQTGEQLQKRHLPEVELAHDLVTQI
jgi:hypothetical protein